jgi:Carboxypeptidase regulatory-like domain/TonB dependent receptor-like, beta-barrel
MKPVKATSRRIFRLVTSVRAAVMLTAALAALLFSGSSFSQANLGRIAGAVKDQSGGAIIGATVSVTDTQRGVTRTLTTDPAGAYVAPGLTPGNYTVRAEAKGFRPVQTANVLVQVGTEVRVDLTLQPGAQEQTITVTGTASLVETSNVTLGGTLSNETINNLPLNGRNFIDLLDLRPGMEVDLGGGTYTRSANGTRADDIGYLVDGLGADEAYTGQSVLNTPIAAGDTSTSLPIDAIQEFNTEQNPKAEFGWKPGAIINAGLKSGTNTIHGSAFAFGRTDALDARNYYNDASGPACVTNPALCQEAGHALKQFGGSVGGPILKDKLFYFASYEGQRYSVNQVLPITTPYTCAGGSAGCGLGATDPAKSLVDACNTVGRANVTPLSALLSGLPAGSCVPNAPSYKPGAGESFWPTNTTGTIVLGMESDNQMDNGVGKIDYHINDHQQLTGMYFRGQGGGNWADGGSRIGLPGAANQPWLSSLLGFVQMGSAGWTWTPNSTWVNEFRVGYSHFRQPYESVDYQVNPTAYGFNSGITDPRFFGFPRMDFQGFGNWFGGNWPKIRGPNSSLQFLDHVSVLHGNHSFMFGGEIIANNATGFITTFGKGRFRFRKGPGSTTTLENFLTGVLASSGGTSAVEAGDPLRHYSNSQWAAFLQDDWRITPRVTLNLGLRYELNTVLKERDNLLGNVDLNSPTGVVQVGYQITSPFNGDHNNFSPRVGIAWDVRGNGKTVVRLGGSIMYETLPIATFADVANALGLSLVPSGATKIYCSGDLTGGCATGDTQIVQQGTGSSGVTQVNLKGTNGLNANWQAQTQACLDSLVASGTSACPTILPTAVINVSCGDGLTFTDGNGVTHTDPPPCAQEKVDRNLRSPYVGTWTLDVQQAFGNNLSLDVAYVGTHGTKLLGFEDVNQPPLGSTNIQTSRPYFSKFPFLSNIPELGNWAESNYNSLQVTMTERGTHGLSFVAGYTYSHALGTGFSNWNGLFVPPDSANFRYLYGNATFDIRHRFTFSTTYNLPSRHSFGQMLEGWSLNSIVHLQTGQPWSPRDTSNDFSGNGQVGALASFGQPWNFFGNPNDFTSGATAIPFFGSNFPQACLNHASLADLNSYGCYMKGNSVLVPPAFGTVGNAGPGIFRDSGYKDWDMSITKLWKFTERLNGQFRAEFFNILNHPAFANPGGPAAPGCDDPSNPSCFGGNVGTPDQIAPNPILGSGGNRSVQLGFKLLW